MDWLAASFALVFALFGVGCLAIVAVGLPGTWMLWGAAVIVELLDGPLLGRGGPGSVTTFGSGLLIGCLGLGLLGEAIEFFAGAAGARMGGSTHRGMWGAVAGGLLGAILLTGLVPIPLVGTLLGALIGTFLGALAGEWSHADARDQRETVRAALAAVVGHLAGILGKLAVGVVIWVLLVRALVQG